MPNRDKEKIDKNFAEIVREWKITYELDKDFIKTTIEEYFRENIYDNSIDKQHLFNYSNKLLYKIINGVRHRLGQFGVDVFSEILKHSVIHSLSKEAKNRTRMKKTNHHNSSVSQESISSKSQNDKRSDLKIENKIMYR
ncbi:MAG: hypothetical protein ACOC5T_07215 [Elusimicrobiota bacterium]